MILYYEAHARTEVYGFCFLMVYTVFADRMKSSTSNPKTDYVYKLEKPDSNSENAEMKRDTAEVYAISNLSLIVFVRYRSFIKSNALSICNKITKKIKLKHNIIGALILGH